MNSTWALQHLIDVIAFTVETVHTRHRFLANGAVAISMEKELRMAFRAEDPRDFFELTASDDHTGVPFMVKGHAITAVEIKKFRLGVSEADLKTPMRFIYVARERVWEDEK